MEQTSKMVEAKNATRLMLFSLQTTKIKLNADHADAQAKLTAIYVPPLSDLPLKELVAQKENSEARALVKHPEVYPFISKFTRLPRYDFSHATCPLPSLRRTAFPIWLLLALPATRTIGSETIEWIH